MTETRIRINSTAVLRDLLRHLFIMPMKSEGLNYLEGSILKTLLITGISMIPATLAMSLFNIVDTFFVGKLGTAALSAMGFCFPIVGIVSCLHHGLSTAIMALLSHALGRGDKADAARMIAHGMGFTVIVSLFIGILGAIFVRPLCALWIETPEVLDYVCQFMQIWFLGSFTIALGLSSHKLVMAIGFPKLAAVWMIAALAVNVILEPIFIFGLGPIPALEMYGAAIATVLAQALTPIGCLYILNKKLNVFNAAVLNLRQFGQSIIRILKFSIPTILGTLINPLAGFIMTTLSAHFGDETVAAMACESRLESIAFVVPMSIGMGLMPMIAQNYGAKQFERIEQIRKLSMRFAGIYLFICAIILNFAAVELVSLFSDDPGVIELGARALRIISWSFLGQEIFRFGGFVFSGCNRPGASAAFNMCKIFAFLIPLSMLCIPFENVNWLFYGRLIAELSSCVIIVIAAKYFIRKSIQENNAPHP